MRDTERIFEFQTVENVTKIFYQQRTAANAQIPRWLHGSDSKVESVVDDAHIRVPGTTQRRKSNAYCLLYAVDFFTS